MLVSGRGVHTGENDIVQGREGEGCGRKSNLQQDIERCEILQTLFT